MIINLPYGNGVANVDLPDKSVLAILRSAEFNSVINEAEAIRNSLNAPIGNEPLSSIASRRSKITIVVSDYTRATPNKILIPLIIEALKKAGRRMDDLKILVAYGLHKPALKDELKEFLSREIVDEVEIVNHNAEDKRSIIYLGETSFGTPIYVNRLIVESDLVVLTGLIEPHFFAGYSGGRKAILPGVAGKESIFHNHSFKMIMHSLSRYGVLSGNPIHEDMVEAAKMIKRTYLLNVVIDKNHKIAGVFAGDIFKAHFEGVKFLDEHVKVKSPSGADIVITSNGGYPLDRDLYQAVKGMATGELIVREGGVIIVFAECVDGIGRGHENFYHLIAEAKTPEEMLERIRREEPIKDQWEAQILARILKKANVILVTKNVKHGLIEDMHMIPASNPEEALEQAYHFAGRNSKIIVVPEGPYVIPAVES
jgi:nickel-dependent lactate racemase